MGKRSVFNPETDAFEGRGLTEWMLNEFTDPAGMLHPVLAAVRSDPAGSLELEIRRHYVNIYYRGANLMEIRQPNPRSAKLTGRFDERYLQRYADTPWRVPPTAEELAVHDWLDANEVLGLRRLSDRSAVEKHVGSFGYRKAAMDASMLRRPRREREAQQRMVLANNALESEYLICDIEYSFAHDHPGMHAGARRKKTSRLDAVAAHQIEGGFSPARLALIELKYGTNAIDGTAGLREHVEDVSRLLVELGNLDVVGEDMVRIVRQKHRLGVVPAPIGSFEQGRSVDYIIAIANHNPRSQRLRDALLGRKNLGDAPLVSPGGLMVKIAILGEDHVLRHDDLITLEDITEENIPAEVFCGTRRDRRYRKDELDAM